MSTFTPPSYQRPIQVSETTMGILGVHPAEPQTIKVDKEIYEGVEAAEYDYYPLEGDTIPGAVERNPATQ